MVQLSQCWGSVTFRYESGSAPLTNGFSSGSRSTSGSCYFVSDLQRQQKLIFVPSFFAYYFLKVHIHHFPKKKKTVEITVFSYYSCLMIEGSGTIPLTNGSRWPKNMRILIRITGSFSTNPYALTIPASYWQRLNKLSSLPTASAQGSSSEDSGDSSCMKKVSMRYVRV